MVKEDPLHKLSRTTTTATRQQQWDVWKDAEKERYSPVKTMPKTPRSPIRIPSTRLSPTIISPRRDPPSTSEKKRSTATLPRVALLTPNYLKPDPTSSLKIPFTSKLEVKPFLVKKSDVSPRKVPHMITTKSPARSASGLTACDLNHNDEKTMTPRPRPHPRPHPPLENVELPDKAAAMELFDRLDENGSNKLSLAELDKGVVTLYPHLNHKPAIMRAYEACDTSEDGFVSRAEFGYFLAYAIYYNHLWNLFSLIDDDDDRRITREEWVDASMDIDIFDQVDTNGGGMILFEELCTYVASKQHHRGDRSNEHDHNAEHKGHTLLETSDDLHELAKATSKMDEMQIFENEMEDPKVQGSLVESDDISY